MLNLMESDTDALRRLLEQLFPGTNISEVGVALLAARMSDLESRYEAMDRRTNFRTTRAKVRKAAPVPIYFHEKRHRWN
jgi:hypothetical protein